MECDAGVQAAALEESLSSLEAGDVFREGCGDIDRAGLSDIWVEREVAVVEISALDG